MESSGQAAKPHAPVADRLVWDKHLWRAEYELKRSKVEVNEREQDRSNWGNLLVAVIPTVVAAGLIVVQNMVSSGLAAEPPVAVSDPLVWEQQKWRAEYELKRREVDLKEKEQQRSTWSSPLVVAILAAAVAGLGSAGVAVINGRLQREIEQNKAAESLRIEESRSEASRILEMIKTGEAEKAAENLQFLIDTGLIRDKERVAQIGAYLKHRQPGTGPFLPAADGRYKFEKSEALTKSVATTLEKNLDDYITYLDRLGLKRDAESVSIRIEKSAEGQPAAYPYYDGHTMVIDQAIADDVDMPRHHYTHHVLEAGHEHAGRTRFSRPRNGDILVPSVQLREAPGVRDSRGTSNEDSTDRNRRHQSVDAIQAAGGTKIGWLCL